MFDRRRFLSSLSSVPVIGTFFGGAAAQAAVKKDYFSELGVRPFINAAGTYTTLTASLMWPEVMDAMQYASKKFYRLGDVQDAVGARIATMLGAESAMVTSGAAGALVVGTAACVTGMDVNLIRRLPDTSGMKNEVIMQKAHRYGYDYAVKAVGMKFVEVETREQLESAVGPQTAMMLFFNAAEPSGAIKAAEFVELGKKHKVPTFNDAAADVPPVENLTKYIKMGFDLVTFSGGKMMRGPQSAGLLLGRKDLIEAARRNTSPNSDTISRGLKVNKEEMLGMLVALEMFMKADHNAMFKEYEKRVKAIADGVSGFKSVKTEMYVPEIANHVPHLKITWDSAALGVEVPAVVKQLREGTPSIEVVPGSVKELSIGVSQMQPGEVEIVVKRLREVMKGGTA
ncbi:MAG TPA: aminotransferase class V-fold PLP-dependent enzyme [Bryobacteraceae bacterium]|nr:aminotransferase class V-fold PLP-dependent enzyme [Bryobacteraceae bacterium]